jgi:plastocyanin
VRRLKALALMGVAALMMVAVSACSPTSASNSQASNPQRVEVHGTEFKFAPAQVTVKVGQPVQLVFVNDGTVDHELEMENMPAKDVTLDLSKAGSIPDDERDEAQGDAKNNEPHAYAAAHGTATVTFTPTKAGTYEMGCHIAGHFEAGMKGTFVVQ